MAYGLSPLLFIENGPAVWAARARAQRSSNAFRAWRSLDADHRLERVEQALCPANENRPHD